MAVNRPLPALFQGVSQQPSAQRALEQVEALENGYATVADGVRKRPPTQYVKKLHAVTPNDAKVHQYFRGDGEHNVVMLYNDGGAGAIKCFDGVTGTEKTVDTTTFPNVLNYLICTNPMDDLGCLTVADTTFIWNKKKVTAMSAASITAQVPVLYIYIKEGRPESNYKVSIIGVGTGVANTTSTASTYTTNAIAANLQTSLQALGGGALFVTSVNGNLITLRRADNADFQFEYHDSGGSSLMSVFKNRVERYSDLPRTFVENQTVEVRGQGDGSSKGSYWVTFKKSGGSQIGHWEETVAPNVGEFTAFDATTMPVALDRLADGTFRLRRITWDTRLVGSTASGSAPVPSFIGDTINSMFFYRNRLGCLSGESIIMSRAGSLYNFWPKSVAIVADDDPIDVTANATKVSVLRHAVPFQRTLMLFSDQTQFPLTGGEILSPKNVRADPATEFDCSRYVAPVSSGQDLYFIFERASAGATYSGVREYTVNQNSVTNAAIDVTAHVPQYIPRHVHSASVSSTEDVLLVLTKDAYNQVYVYKYLWDGEKKVQSAWFRWTFRLSDKILSAAVDKTTVSFVIQRVDGVHLERMELQSTATTPGLPFQVHLDSLATDYDYLSGGPRAYDEDNDETFIFPPGLLADWVPEGEGEVVLVAGNFPKGAGATLPIVGPQGVGWRVKGDWSDSAIPVYIGVKYRHAIGFSEQFMRDNEGVAITEGRLQLKHFTINFRGAVTFKAQVQSFGREVAEYKWTSFKVGLVRSIIGSPVVMDDSFTFPVASRSDSCHIVIINDSPYPATFYSAEWEGEFNTRSRR